MEKLITRAQQTEALLARLREEQQAGRTDVDDDILALVAGEAARRWDAVVTANKHITANVEKAKAKATGLRQEHGIK